MAAGFRHEMKYIIPTYLHQEMSAVFREIMAYDRHAGPEYQYNIRSLYFDDMYHSAYNEKLDGIQHRRKYRIRIYNCKDRRIVLECKHKDGAYIYKENVPISRDEYDSILAGEAGFLLKRPEPVAREFYIDYRSKLLRPEVIVEYDREPFIFDTGTVRITFDKGLRAIHKDGDMFDPNARSLDILGKSKMILEIKFTGILPEQIRRLFNAYEIVQTNASKYCMCVDRISPDSPY